ncbi:MAG TPA: long-chain fatty acid--CoA ligase [Chthonomonadaceae bacterium]|nr:long-chain fatty acid--CoA ligase [Chthonomonadaceae bacterium]
MGFQTGMMMDAPLTITAILRRAAQFFPEKEIVSRLNDGSIHRYTYADLYRRVIRLMHVLRNLGVKPGDRVATFAWNSYRHLELYFAVPCLGAILHTVNIRLFPEQLTYIFNHAEDRLIFADKSLAGLLTPLQSELKTVEGYVLMDDRGEAPAALPGPAWDYEELLASASDVEAFPCLDENMAASICYTSGTTGEPKGVLYTHRSLYLHTMACCMGDTMDIREREIVLPVVPMFHANAWGMPYACAMAGATQVLPGSHLFGKPLAELIERERVTIAAGVPTVWNLLYQYLQQHPHDLSRLKVILSGGSAVPRVLFENYTRDYGITMIQAWGMTEMSPLGSLCRLKASMEDWPEEQQLAVRMKQGIPTVNVEVKLLGEQGEELPWDGKQAGELAVRGPWVACAYYANADANAAFTQDGWFRTGDIATLDAHGYLEITDRKKDVIKSRGEWISSVDMENAVMGHPAVLEAAVVGRLDDLRGEAPVVYIVLRHPDQPLPPQEVLDVLKARFARWQLPRQTDIHVVASLPKTGVGKVDKKAIRRNLTE